MKPIRKAFALTLAIAGAWTAPSLMAQQAAAISQPTESSQLVAPARPAMWKISDEDTTIFLFGTIHLLPKNTEWYDGKVADAFERSQELVTELPEIPQSQLMSATMQMGALPTGQTLRGAMTANERQKFEAALQSLEIPKAAFDGMKPWLASVALTTLPLIRAGYSSAHGVDMQLSQRNRAMGRPRLGLETLEYQLGIFDGLSPGAQKAYLFDAIDALPNLPQDIDKILAAWSKGDEQTLATLLNDAMDDPALYKVLLSDRNRHWAKWIDERLDRPGTVFIAVGAGHLGGRDSVQEFLGRAGIKVERVQ